MSVTKSYSIAHLNLLVECDDEPLGKKVINALDDYFSFKNNGSIRGLHHIHLKFKNSVTPFQSAENVQELFRSDQLSVLKNGNSCYLVGEKTHVQLELLDGQGTAYIDHTFWNRPPKSQQEFMMLSLLWLFHKQGLYAIHGNALVKDEVGIFIVGDTCSGKSTTALSLIPEGWNYLSDDVTLLKKASNGIKAFAIQKGFSFDPRLAAHYSPLKETLKSSSFNGQKRFADISTVYSDRFQTACVPKILIFPNIISQGKSRIMPIDKTTALIMLMKNSGGIMVDKEMAAQQIEVLKVLINQTTSYQLLAGRDLYEKPEKISEVLSVVEMI